MTELFRLATRCRWTKFLTALLLAACARTTPSSSHLADNPPHGGGSNRKLFSAPGRYLIVEALRDDIVHFELSAVGTGDVTQPIYTTPMVAKTDYPGPTSFVSDEQHIETAALKVTVDDLLCATIFDKVRGVQLNKTCPENMDQPWKGLVLDSPRTKNVYGLGQYFAAESSDGDWVGRVWDPLADGYGARLRGFAGGANDFSMFPIMYALGEGKESYAMFVDQVYKQMWDFRAAPWHVGMWGDQIRWYVMSAADLPTLRRDYMELTGKPPVPPKRSFGLWVSEFGFSNWGEIDQELADLRAHHFPVDGFALDLQWFGGAFGDPDHSRMGSLTWNEDAFPDPRGKIQSYENDSGVNLMLIEEPYISKTLTEHDALSVRGYMARDCQNCAPTYLNYNPWWGRGGMLDYTNPAAGDFWHDFRRQPLAAMGINDHWGDLGEPEQYNANAWYYGFPELGKHAHADIHNIYGFDWMASIARGYDRNHNAKRPFLLSRTGTSGIQRFGAALWSGDIGSHWGNLRSQMNAQMHMSLSGIDYYGSDVGGFQNTRETGPGGPELLYTQWFAASAALDVPIRPHAWNLDKQRPTAPSIRGDTEANLANLRRRYELAPYYYSLAHIASLTGDPVFPPLVHYYQEDANVRRTGDEKLIGKDVLVALVADPSAVSRDVYLPAGTWFDLASGDATLSHGEVLAGRPLYDSGAFRLPMFARAGAILPTAFVDDQTLNIRGKRAGSAPDQTFGLKIFAAAVPSSFNVYEDDGEANSATQLGQTAVTHVTQAFDGNSEQIGIEPSQGSFPGLAAERPYAIELYTDGLSADGVVVNGRSIADCIGQSTAACYSNSSNGKVAIRTGVLSVSEPKHISVSLHAAALDTPSLYFVCRNASPGAGVAVYVTGDDASLGAWNAAQAVKLKASAPSVWTGRVQGLAANAAVNWKCLQRRDDGTGEVTWQPGANSAARTRASGYSGTTTGAF